MWVGGGFKEHPSKTGVEGAADRWEAWEQLRGELMTGGVELAVGQLPCF